MRQPQQPLGQGSPTPATMDEAALDAQNEVEVVEQYEISDDEADEFDYDAVKTRRTRKTTTTTTRTLPLP